ncbi:MAG: anti-sigma factor family protein, partial [Planctomycetota bacterium]
MQRKEAEKLLAALIFDDLDETSKTELLNYLQTDNELRERLADMRMAVKVASDTVQHGPDPVLGKRRLKRLARLARHQRSWPTFFTVPRLAAAAAIFIVSALFLTGIQTLDKEVPLADVLKRIEPAYAVEQTVEADTPSESPGKQTPEVTSTRRQFAFHPAARSPGAVDSGTVLGLPETVTDLAFQDDSRNFIVDDFGEFHGAETSSPQGYAYLPTRPDSIERRTSASTWESKPHSEIRAGNEYDGMGRFPGGGMGGYGGGGYGGGMMGGYGDGSGYGSGGYGGMGRGNGKTGGYRGSPFGWGGGGLYSSYGGMGGFGGGGYSGVGGSGGGMMVDYGVYGDGKGYSASGWKGGNGRDAVNGSESGDRLFVKGDTYDGDKDFGSKGTNLFDISSDDPAVVADGDSIPGSGRVTFQNGKAVGTKIDGSTIDSFDVVVGKDGAPSPVTVVAGQPVIFTKPDDPGIVSDGGGEAVGGGFFFQNG